MTLTYLHTMVRVKDLEKTVTFFELLGLKETRRIDSEGGRFSLIFMAAPDQEDSLLSSLTIGMATMNCRPTAAILATLHTAQPIFTRYAKN